MSQSIPFVIRPYAEADFADVLGVIQAADAADSVHEMTSAADLRFHLDDPAWRGQDAFVAEAPGQGVVAYVFGLQRRGPDGHLYLTDASVHPAFRRRGIGRALLQQQWQRVQEISAELAQPVTLGCRAFTTQTAALALLESFGMTRVRYFFEMRRSLAEPVPALALPAHLTLRTLAVRPAEEDVWRALNEAFADHWNHVETPFSEFQHRLTSGHTNPDASFVVWDGDEVAGGAMNDMGPEAGRRRGDNHAWVSILFVRRPWRQQGLGRALLIASMHKAAELGHTGVGLNVDAENLTGAVRLYEGVGLRVTATRVAFQKTYP
jgi:mycothiol synthase